MTEQNENVDKLAEDLLALPKDSAIRFSYDGKSSSYPLSRFQQMAREWREYKECADTYFELVDKGWVQ